MKVLKYFLQQHITKDGEENEWRQERVRQFFAEDELLIGKDYWNFVCDDEQGFEIVYNQYQKSCTYILDALERIKNYILKINEKRALVQAYLISFVLAFFVVGGIYVKTLNMESSRFAYPFEKK